MWRTAAPFKNCCRYSWLTLLSAFVRMDHGWVMSSRNPYFLACASYFCTIWLPWSDQFSVFSSSRWTESIVSLSFQRVCQGCLRSFLVSWPQDFVSQFSVGFCNLRCPLSRLHWDSHQHSCCLKLSLDTACNCRNSLGILTYFWSPVLICAISRANPSYYCSNIASFRLGALFFPILGQQADLGHLAKP